jgi:hypothetical protein
MVDTKSELPVRLVIDPEAAAVSRHTTAAHPTFEPWVDRHGTEFGCCWEEGDDFHVRIYGAGSFQFNPHSWVVLGVPDPDVRPRKFYRVFCRKVLHLVLQMHSCEVLHANGLVVQGTCIALCGACTMGKSTLSYAWYRRGGSVFADDMLAYRADDRAIRICPMPFRLRPRPPATEVFGPPTPDAPEWVEREEYSSELGDGVMRALYFVDRRPEEADPTVLFELVRPTEALPALLGQSLCLTVRDRQRNRGLLDHYISLVDRVPVFRFSYPTGLQHVDRILDRLSDHVCSLTAPGPEE